MQMLLKLVTNGLLGFQRFLDLLPKTTARQDRHVADYVESYASTRQSNAHTVLDLQESDLSFRVRADQR